MLTHDWHDVYLASIEKTWAHLQVPAALWRFVKTQLYAESKEILL